MTVKHKNMQPTYKDVNQSYYSLFLIYFEFLFPRSVDFDFSFDLAFSHMSLVNCNNPDV